MNPTMDDVRAAYYAARAAGAAVEPGHVNPNDPRSLAGEIARLNAARAAHAAPAPMFAPGVRPAPPVPPRPAAGPLTAKGMNGVVTFDGRVVTIIRGVIRGPRDASGRGTKRIPLRLITSVRYKKPGLTNGFIVFTVPGDGGSETVAVHPVQAKAFAALKDAVEAAMLEA